MGEQSLGETILSSNKILVSVELILNKQFPNFSYVKKVLCIVVVHFATEQFLTTE